jgi:hypothetical protein
MTTDTFFTALALATARNAHNRMRPHTPVCPNWFWGHQIPETFCGEELVWDNLHSSLGGGLGDVWVELSPGQEAFLTAAFPGVDLGDALQLALGDLPRD